MKEGKGKKKEQFVGETILTFFFLHKMEVKVNLMDHRAIKTYLLDWDRNHIEARVFVACKRRCFKCTLALSEVSLNSRRHSEIEHLLTSSHNAGRCIIHEALKGMLRRPTDRRGTC